MRMQHFVSELCNVLIGFLELSNFIIVQYNLISRIAYDLFRKLSSRAQLQVVQPCIQ